MFLHIEFGMLPVTVLKLLIFKWSAETLRHAYEDLVNSGYLTQRKTENLKVTYVTVEGFNAYNEFMIKHKDTPYTDWPKPEYDVRKAESLALQNEVSVFFFLLQHQSQHEFSYYPRAKERENMVNMYLRSDDKFRYSRYKGILEYISDRGRAGAVVYNFGSSNRDESDGARENVQTHIMSTRGFNDNTSPPLIIFGYDDCVPISIVDYSIRLSQKAAAELAGMKNKKHFHLSNKCPGFDTYFFPLTVDSLLIMSQWSNHLTWHENCLKLNNAWCKQKGTNAPPIIDCNLSNIKDLAANTRRPLNILLHDYQVNVVNTILRDVPNPEMVFLNPITPDEFAYLMKAVTLGQALQFPNHLCPLDPAPQVPKRKRSKPPQKRQWKDTKPRAAAVDY